MKRRERESTFGIWWEGYEEASKQASRTSLKCCLLGWNWACLLSWNPNPTTYIYLFTSMKPPFTLESSFFFLWDKTIPLIHTVTSSTNSTIKIHWHVTMSLFVFFLWVGHVTQFPNLWAMGLRFHQSLSWPHSRPSLLMRAFLTRILFSRAMHSLILLGINNTIKIINNLLSSNFYTFSINHLYL